MKKKKSILLVSLIVMIMLALPILLLNYKNWEENWLISRALKAQSKLMSDNPSQTELLFGRYTDYSKEYDRILEKLIKKGYFKKVEVHLKPNQLEKNKLSRTWSNLWDNSEEEKLMFYSQGPIQSPNPKYRTDTIVLIGPVEIVNKKYDLLVKLMKDDSN